MDYEFRELVTEDDFKQCIDLQKSLFNLSETEVISPLLLRLIARNNPPTGISLGIFSHGMNGIELIGFMIGFATFIDRSIYGLMIGIRPDQQNKGYGYKLFLKFREKAITMNLDCMYGIVDPLEANLAYLYFANLRFTGIKYEEETYVLSNVNRKIYIPIDKLLIRWDFNKDIHLNQDGLLNNKEILNKYPLVNSVKDYNSDYLLYKIPYDFKNMQKENPEKALQLRLESRSILKYLINESNYHIISCLTDKKGEKTELFYLLQKMISPG